MRLLLGLPSDLSSPLPFKPKKQKQKQIKTTGTSSTNSTVTLLKNALEKAVAETGGVSSSLTPCELLLSFPLNSPKTSSPQRSHSIESLQQQFDSW